MAGEDLEVEVVRLVVLDRLSRATTKKVVNFLRKKSAPPDKILAPGYGYVVIRVDSMSIRCGKGLVITKLERSQKQQT